MNNGNYSRTFLTSKLIAASCYTRSLWNLFSVFRRFFTCPYRGHAIEWGVDVPYCKKHFLRALIYSMGWLLLESVLFVLFLVYSNALIGFFLIFLVLVQWFVYPWFITRKIFSDIHETKSESTENNIPNGIHYISGENDGLIPDLGFMFRDATFCLDMTQKRTIETPNPVSGVPPYEEFYQNIENKVHETAPAYLWSDRVFVSASESVQPGSSIWSQWFNPFIDRLAKPDATESVPRLFLFGQHPEVDGLSTAELEIRTLKDYISFNIHLRWLPPLKRRFNNMFLVSKEKPIWRTVFVPLILALIIVIQWMGINVGLLMLQGKNFGEFSFETLFSINENMLAAVATIETRNKDQLADELGALTQQIEELSKQATEISYDALKNKLISEKAGKLAQLQKDEKAVEVKYSDLLDFMKAYPGVQMNEYGENLKSNYLMEKHNLDKRRAALGDIIDDSNVRTLLIQKKIEINDQIKKLESQMATLVETYTKYTDYEILNYFCGGLEIPFQDPWTVTILQVCFAPIRHGGGMGPAVWLSVVITVLPILFLIILIGYRMLRYCFRLIYAASGKYFNVQCGYSFRFKNTTFTIDDKSSLKWGTFFLQISEEIFMNSIIKVLKEYNIDSSKLKDELQIFVNQGIYMTGGSLKAESIAAGKSARIFSRWTKKEMKTGGVSIIGTSASKKNK